MPQNIRKRIFLGTFPLKRAVPLFLGILVLLSACREGFDNDLVYAPETKASYFLVQDSANPNQRMVLEISPENLVKENWQNQFGLAPTDLGSFSGREDRLWLSNPSAKTVLEVDLKAQSLLSTISTGDLTPHVLVSGERQLLLGDSTAPGLAFFDLKKDEFQKVETAAKTRFLLYNSGKFYVCGDTLIEIWDERALTRRTTLSTEKPISQAQITEFGDLLVLACDSNGCDQYLVDANGDLFAGGGPSSKNYQRQWVSPWLEVKFGREYLEDFRLRNGELLPVELDSVGNAFVDFFESRIFIWRTSQVNGLEYYGLDSDSLVGSGERLTGHYPIHSYFYIDNSTK